MIALLTGVLLGLAGSGHCVGMCGPLVLTLGRSLGRPSRSAQVQHSLTYHAGRILTYVTLALPAGLAGRALSAGGLGRAVAVVAGVVMLLFAANSLRAGIFGRLGVLASVASARVCLVATRWSRHHPVAGPLVSGMGNGLVPCGLVYAALAAAAATGSPGGAVLTMVGFGLGTTPPLLAVTLAAAWVAPALRLSLRRLAPVALVIVAVLLIMRGLAPARHSPVPQATPAAVAHH